MIFEKKKIQIETLSEYLIAVRSNLNLSREDVSKKTSIKLKFLSSLEDGDFKILPADVYVLGFLRQLADLYSVEAGELIEQYKKEKGIQKQISKQECLQSQVWYKQVFHKVIITPKALSLVIGVLFVLLTVGYIVWQVWSINKTPSLQILEPIPNSVIKGSSVEIKGKTDSGMSVTINGQNIFVDNMGNFQTQLGLSAGPEDIFVVAKNRFDKSISKTISVTGMSDVSPSQGQLTLKVDFTGTVVLGFAIDDQQGQTLSFNAGDSKTFSAKQKIILSTNDAGATKITLNGQSLGSMGKPKESLSNVPFFPQPASVNSAK